jgi:hypothetical protein
MTPGYLSRRLEFLDRLIEDAEERLARMSRLKNKFDPRAWGPEFGSTVRAMEAHLGELREKHAEVMRARATGEDSGA